MSEFQAEQRDWQLQVTERLGELLSGNREIVRRLDVINGSVAEHEKKFWQIAQLINDSQRILATESARADGVAHEAQRWSARFKPFVLMVALIFLGIILGHANEVLRLIQQR